MRRGEIYYIGRGAPETGSEQRAGRPAIIVSSDRQNEYGATVEIVYLTTKPKKDEPTHIDIRSAPKPSTAICEQITTVAKERIEGYVGRCTESEMIMIDAAMQISLGIEYREDAEDEDEGPAKDEEREKIIRLEAERDTYKRLYEAMLERTWRGAENGG